MKRFVFRLEGVLRIRAFEFDRARIRLARLEEERRKRQAEVERATAHLERGHAILEREGREGADGERLALRAAGVSMGRRALESARLSRAQLDPPLLEAREAVRRTRARVRSLERLRERLEEDHRRVGRAAEQAEIEELAMARMTRDDASTGRVRAEEVG
ncbi:MAG TPA: hypothetical protein ENI85_14905 [Deltaproteobacteria bacterium]|nr:hypothetical protein [Deltaproteobacteria bacterium]